MKEEIANQVEQNKNMSYNKTKTEALETK